MTLIKTKEITTLSVEAIKNSPQLGRELNTNFLAIKLLLDTLFLNIHKLTITTTNPNGSRTGRKGEMLIYEKAGTPVTYYLMVGLGGTSWKGVQLGTVI